MYGDFFPTATSSPGLITIVTKEEQIRSRGFGMGYLALKNAEDSADRNKKSQGQLHEQLKKPFSIIHFCFNLSLLIIHYVLTPLHLLIINVQ